jgi:hypothetical protein
MMRNRGSAPKAANMSAKCVTAESVNFMMLHFYNTRNVVVKRRAGTAMVPVVPPDSRGSPRSPIGTTTRSSSRW